ncbi:hypothetical protein ACMBCN_02845, partial [Candidatus Liberibacter asiaticus]|nr:hypothetical protein [Candidatus Liberibacter asiaticus]
MFDHTPLSIRQLQGARFSSRTMTLLLLLLLLLVLLLLLRVPLILPFLFLFIFPSSIFNVCLSHQRGGYFDSELDKVLENLTKE